MTVFAGVCFILGLFGLLYYIILLIYAGVASAFSWFWLFSGLAFMAAGTILKYMKQQDLTAPKTIRFIISGFIVFGLTLFFILEVIIVLYGNKIPQNGADYIIILGAHVKGTVITNSLKNRLDEGIQYLNHNPATKVIVSGGQGYGELVTEAYAMEEYLLKQGIDKNRIIKEDKSTNTNENLLFSSKFTGLDKKVVIVSNSFHIYRASQIAKRQGYVYVQGLGAPSDKLLVPSYYVRESLSIIKDYLIGNM